MKENIVTCKLEGKVLFRGPCIEIDNGQQQISLPEHLTAKLLRRIGSVSNIEKALQEKPYYARGHEESGHVQWFSVVSQKFSPVHPEDIRAALAQLGVTDVTEQSYGAKHVSFHVPLKTSLQNMFAWIDLGRYGLWGGNGESAVKYGVSWFYPLCTNWTFFLHKDKRMNGKLIHCKKEQSDFDSQRLEERLGALTFFAQEVEQKIEEGKTVEMDTAMLGEYLKLYRGRGIGKQLAEAIREACATKSTLYDVSYNMTRYSQTLTRTPHARSQVNMLAGELLLHYPAIQEKITAMTQKAEGIQ